MSIPEKPRLEPSGHGIRKDERGQDQPSDKSRAQKVTRGDMAGRNAQRDSATMQQPFPGEPAGGE
jgi:hypothetical protein